MGNEKPGGAQFKLMKSIADPQISVALVTRNRADSLTRTLQSLRRQSVQPLEVVISDDSNDGIRERIERISGDFGCQYISGPRRGLYANRNHAALACCGTHIRTMDDDHEFPPEHFDVVAEAVKQSPEDIWIISERSKANDFKTLQNPSQLGPSGYGYSPCDTDDCWAIADGCTVYPKRIFGAGIRMVEEWPFGQAYLEFGARLYFEYGKKCRLVNGTHVVHHFENGLRLGEYDLIEGASAVYAALAYSWRFRPHIVNKIATLRNLMLLMSKRGRRGWDAICWGVAVSRKKGYGLTPGVGAGPTMEKVLP